MNLARRCRPSLAATTVLTALLLGACSYSPERSLTVSDAAKPAGGKQVATAETAKPGQASKPRKVATSGDSRTAEANRRTAAADTKKQPSSPQYSPRRQLVASNNERECLMRAMYFESHRSSREGLVAVGTVVMNRVNSPSYPNTICGVVGQRNQFAPGVLSRSMSPRDRHHAEAAADEVLAGKRHEGIGDAMFFHVATRRYQYPNMRYLQVAGGNIFYRKVGRNAPQVVDGPVLAYAAPAPEAPAATVATEAPVVATTTQQPAQEAATVVAAAAPAKRPAVAPTQVAAASVPLPPPRIALTVPKLDTKTAEPAVDTAAAAPVSVAAAAPQEKPAAEAILRALPIDARLTSYPTFSMEPSTRLSYRSVSAPRQAE